MLIIPPSLAAGAPPGRPAPVDKRELEARRDFAEARYEDALHLFAALFSEVDDPIYLRNIARCYQKMQRPAEAIAMFRDYLQKGKLGPTEREEIESYIAEMETLRRTQRTMAAGAHERQGQAAPDHGTPVPARPTALETPPPAVVTTTPPTATAPAPPASPVNLLPDAPESGRRRLDPVGLVVGAAGVVLVGVGVGFGLAARSAAREVEMQYDAARDTQGARYERWQWTAYAAGGVALATGAVLLIARLRSSRSDDRTERHARLGPTASGLEARF